MTDQTGRPDAALLAAARTALGTGGTDDTVEAALALAVRRHRRDRAVEAELARLAPVPPGRTAPEPSGLPAGWLLDESARLAAVRDPAVAAGLRPLLTGGLLHTCPLLDLAALTAPAPHVPGPGEATDGAGADPDPRRVLTERRLAYRSVPTGPDAGERALELHRVLVRAGRPRVAGPTALLVAATALEHGLGVLHDDPGLTLLGRLAGLCERLVAPAGAGVLGRAS